MRRLRRDQWVVITVVIAYALVCLPGWVWLFVTVRPVPSCDFLTSLANTCSQERQVAWNLYFFAAAGLDVAGQLTILKVWLRYDARRRAREQVAQGEENAMGSGDALNRLRTDVPHGARVWNAALGGKDHFEPDRRALAAIKNVLPDFEVLAAESRRALIRMIEYLVRNEGVSQFLDIGTGLPTYNNTHQVAQRLNPAARIVYVDNDPMVLIHARALLTSSSRGATDYIDADLRHVEQVLDQARRTLDFTLPVGLILFGILGYVAEVDEAQAIVRRYVDALPSGSFLAVNDGVAVTPVEWQAGEVARGAGQMYWLRSEEQFGRFFEGLELVAPGIVRTPHWRPEAEPEVPSRLAGRCGLARKV